MQIQITNGNLDPANQDFEEYLDRLEQSLLQYGHSVNRTDLRQMDMRGCNGCFKCWLKTPGECILPDEGPILRQAIIQSDFHLLASPLAMGFPSALLKTALDKSLPLIHPYFAVVHGEAHHRARYARYPRLGLLLQAESTTDAADLHIVADIFSRAALNMKSALDFATCIDRPVDELVGAITGSAPRNAVRFDKRLGPVSGQTIAPPTRLTVFNGSPRGGKGNTPILLDHFLRGFISCPGNTYELFHLNRLHDREQFQAAFASAECVLLGFPLYVDAMPGQVKAFIESLADFAGRQGNPPFGFLVQSGFPEAAHSRHVERYLEKLAGRLGSPYLGTLIRGGVEGIQTQPEQMTAKLFTIIEQLGRVFAETGQFDPALKVQLAGLERFPAILGPLFRLLMLTPLLNFYWDQDLKKNGVFEQRFARPYQQ